jgi:Ribbon-helix-helix protein, copG family
MKRTTIYLEPELEVLLKLEVLRQGRPMAELVREALHAYVRREPARVPPGAGAFASGHADTAERAEELLREAGFGVPAAAPRGRRRPAASAKRRRSRA